MSDILIKNMTKPKSCFECRFDCIQRSEDGNEHFCFVTRSFIAKHSFSESMKNFVLGNCPLVEVKPHGRLIDADLEIKRLDDAYCNDCDNWNGIKCKTCDVYDTEIVLADAPTVLEAST